MAFRYPQGDRYWPTAGSCDRQLDGRSDDERSATASTWICVCQPVALVAYGSVVDRFGCNGLIEQITPAPCRRQSGVGRDGFDRSWWLLTADRFESIREHEQSLEVLREVYSKLLAGFPKHAQPIRFVDLRIRQCK